MEPNESVQPYCDTRACFIRLRNIFKQSFATAAMVMFRGGPTNLLFF